MVSVHPAGRSSAQLGHGAPQLLQRAPSAGTQVVRARGERVGEGAVVPADVVAAAGREARPQRVTDGAVIGEVSAVRHEAQDLLVVRRPDAAEALIPFVSAIVPTVDVAGGFLVVDPPEGLLEL